MLTKPGTDWDRTTTNKAATRASNNNNVPPHTQERIPIEKARLKMETIEL